MTKTNERRTMWKQEPRLKKKRNWRRKNRDAKVLEWLHKVLNDGGIFCHPDYDCWNYDSHLIFDEVNTRFICIGYAKSSGVWAYCRGLFFSPLKMKG
jgi:hypothetical protein